MLFDARTQEERAQQKTARMRGLTIFSAINILAFVQSILRWNLK